MEPPVRLMQYLLFGHFGAFLVASGLTWNGHAVER